MMLILLFSPVLLEPVNKLLEGCVVLLMEVESLWTHLDELLDNPLFWNVPKHYVLWVSWQDGKSVWDSGRVLLLLFLKLRL